MNKEEYEDYRDEEIMADMLNGNIARIRMSDSQKEIDKMVEYAKARIEALAEYRKNILKY